MIYAALFCVFLIFWRSGLCLFCMWGFSTDANRRCPPLWGNGSDVTKRMSPQIFCPPPKIKRITKTQEKIEKRYEGYVTTNEDNEDDDTRPSGAAEDQLPFPLRLHRHLLLLRSLHVPKRGQQRQQQQMLNRVAYWRISILSLSVYDLFMYRVPLTCCVGWQSVLVHQSHVISIQCNHFPLLHRATLERLKIMETIDDHYQQQQEQEQKQTSYFESDCTVSRFVQIEDANSNSL